MTFLHNGNCWESYDLDLTPCLGQNITLRSENWSWPEDDEYRLSAVYNTWTYIDDLQFVP